MKTEREMFGIKDEHELNKHLFCERCKLCVTCKDCKCKEPK